MNLDYYKINLEKAGVVFEKGLTSDEIVEVERFYDFIFPPDLKEFLMFALPVSKGWINWREIGSEQIESAFKWIYEGVNFDIEHNAFWINDWGEKPEDLQKAFSIAEQKIKEAPKLIPIYSHRYIPSVPNEIDNPVFSVYQTDIVYYGNNLWNYLEKEFCHYFEKQEHQTSEPVKKIDFWSRFAEDLV